MDKYETIENIVENYNNVSKDTLKEYIFEAVDALDAAIEALKMRTPKKPVTGYMFNEKFREILDEEYANLKGDCCPNCKRYIGKTESETKVFGRSGNPYCPYCGQAIDWSE